MKKEPRILQNATFMFNLLKLSVAKRSRNVYYMYITITKIWLKINLYWGAEWRYVGEFDDITVKYGHVIIVFSFHIKSRFKMVCNAPELNKKTKLPTAPFLIEKGDEQVCEDAPQTWPVLRTMKGYSIDVGYF